jgi:hypothetical protein
MNEVCLGLAERMTFRHDHLFDCIGLIQWFKACSVSNESVIVDCDPPVQTSNLA